MKAAHRSIAVNATMPQVLENRRLRGQPDARALTGTGMTADERNADATHATGAGMRFTLDGSQSLERHLNRICRRVRTELQAIIPADKLTGILLGGGYGRGEGGVLRTPAGDRPYNDLEFYVFLDDRFGLATRRLGPALHTLHERLTELAGIEVEFKLLTLESLRRSAPSMFYYDLVMGHRWVLGDDRLLAGCEHHRDAARIPLAEAARLWMNRATGLLFAAQRLTHDPFTEADADFIGRNLAKARLAFGDIVLTALGRYHWSCRERNERLRRLDPAEVPFDLAALGRLHDAGVAFKLHPVETTAPRPTLAAAHRELAELAGGLLLWLERRRLGAGFRNLEDYALGGVDKCPESPAWRNWLITARALGLTAALRPGATQYPRARLFESLALQLRSEPPVGPALRYLQRRLGATASDPTALMAAHETLWRRFG